MDLLNIDARLQNLYGNNYSFDIRNKSQENGVETVIRIPAN